MPTIANGFAHLLNYSEHMTTVHYENGNYHVHYEYIEAAKKNAREDSPYNNTLKKIDNTNEHLMLTTQGDPRAPAHPQDYLNPLFQYLPVISLQEDFRPPILTLFAPVA